MKKLLIEILITASAILIIGCGDERMSEKAMIPELDSIDYEIISSALEQYIVIPKSLEHRRKFKQETDEQDLGLIVLCDSTIVKPPKPHITDVLRLFDSNDKYLTERIVGENRKSYKIDSAKVKTRMKILIVSTSFLYGNIEFLDSVYQSISYGVIRISKPSYSVNGDKAVIYINKVGWDTNEDCLLWMKREVNNWIAYDIMDYTW